MTKKMMTLLCVLLLAATAACTAPADRGQSAAGLAGEKSAATRPIRLPAPQSEQDAQYLGLSGSGSFPIQDIKAEAVIIEFYSMYCPHCQREAPRVNDLFAEVENRPELRDKIKLIGVGVGNSPYELTVFKEKYGVVFPLFSDEELKLLNRLNVSQTPTFIAVRINDDGSFDEVYRHSGAIGDLEEFIMQIKQSAGIE